MAVEDMAVEIILDTDLRDTTGQHLKIGKITQVTGTYSKGGLTIDPSFFGLTEMVYFSIVPSFALPGAGDGPWELQAQLSLRSFVEEGHMVWKLIYFYNNSGSFVEVPDDTTIGEWSDDQVISFMAIGA